MDNFGHIRQSFDSMANAFLDFKRNYPYQEVYKVVHELKKDHKDQKLSFDLKSGKLLCNSPEMLHNLIKIQQNKRACKQLLSFCESATLEQSIPEAIAIFEEQNKVYWNFYDVFSTFSSTFSPGDTKSY